MTEKELADELNKWFKKNKLNTLWDLADVKDTIFHTLECCDQLNDFEEKVKKLSENFTKKFGDFEEVYENIDREDKAQVVFKSLKYNCLVGLNYIHNSYETPETEGCKYYAVKPVEKTITVYERIKE